MSLDANEDAIAGALKQSLVRLVNEATCVSLFLLFPLSWVMLQPCFYSSYRICVSRVAIEYSLGNTSIVMFTKERYQLM